VLQFLNKILFECATRQVQPVSSARLHVVLDEMTKIDQLLRRVLSESVIQMLCIVPGSLGAVHNTGVVR